MTPMIVCLYEQSLRGTREECDCELCRVHIDLATVRADRDHHFDDSCRLDRELESLRAALARAEALIDALTTCAVCGDTLSLPDEPPNCDVLCDDPDDDEVERRREQWRAMVRAYEENYQPRSER